MNKYEPLYEYLSRSGQSTVRLSFAEIEKILGDNLPASAYTHKQWWTRGGHPQDKAWLKAGYKVDDVRLDMQAAIFKRQ